MPKIEKSAPNWVAALGLGAFVAGMLANIFLPVL